MSLSKTVLHVIEHGLLPVSLDLVTFFIVSRILTTSKILWLKILLTHLRIGLMKTCWIVMLEKILINFGVVSAGDMAKDCLLLMRSKVKSAHSCCATDHCVNIDILYSEIIHCLDSAAKCYIAVIPKSALKTTGHVI